MIQVGKSASLTKTFTENEVRTFAEISGDHNPLHIDAEFAASTQFKRQLVHGMLVAGMISAVLGMQLPGPGCIYLKQELNFRAPVYFGDTITATVTVTKVRPDKPIITLETTCTNHEGITVIDGEALLKAPKQPSKG
jgi:3-hydroxybutyryl-CoA dehydratase